KVVNRLEKAIVVDNVSKKYKLYTTSKERLFDLLTPKSYGNDFFALKNINFTANKGEVIGFVGINGSGKSTLSNIIAGIVPATSGEVTVNGETSLIAVSAGLKGDLTGRDNIEMKLLMLGFNKKEILDLESSIIEFSELGEFIDQPVKSYSSGMKSRLGFSISVNVDPEILIIDEALSVGDKAFAEKSLSKMQEFKEMGKTMIFVSHSIGQMKKFCEKILWLEFGRVKDFGSVEDVIPKYEKFLDRWKSMSKEDREVYKNYSLNQNKEGLKSLINIDVEKEESKQNSMYTEEPTSRLAHIKGKASYIYKTPKNSTETQSADKWKNSVYYVKKRATHNGKKYYLLSNEPSAVEGVVGWIETTDVIHRRHLFIEDDPKVFVINGIGSAYIHPWGGSDNIV